MKNLLKTLACFGCAMLIGASSVNATDFVPKQKSALGNVGVSVGRNLEAKRKAAVAFGNDNPVKTHPAAAPGKVKGLKVNPRGVRRAATCADNMPLMSESFESCSHFSDEMPQGWSIESKGEVPTDEEDHWRGISRNYSEDYMFAPPADGNMMVGVFYNDDIYKDEWLISPEINISGESQQLSFYWFTVPYYLFAVDRFHVDFVNGVFIDREVVFNVEVLAQVVGEDSWTKIFDLASEFDDVEYDELAETLYDVMQRVILPLNAYVGKDIRIAFRYWGKEGNTFTLDAVSIGSLPPEVSYMPYYNRLYYGYSYNTPDDLVWLEPAIELCPVNHPVTYYNTSPDIENCEFSWEYMTLDENAEVQWTTDNSRDELNVTYRPDYTSKASQINNFYSFPLLRGRNPGGPYSDYYTVKSDFLQAGGSPQMTTAVDGSVASMKYLATQFDFNSHGYLTHLEEDEQLGFMGEPIFGRSVNTDAWWEHYCFPNGKTDEQYAYVDGFLNMYFPHPKAPLVVNGVSALAIGRINDQAEFTLKIYSMTKWGEVIEKPIVTKTIGINDIISYSGFSTSGDYLVLNFDLEEPVIFDSKGTGYAYLVEVSGYRNENVEYFAPVQAKEPNEYEWALSFYHIYRSGKENDLTNQISYVACFKDYLGRDLYSSFAIGLDAAYPWLELANSDEPFIKTDNSVEFALNGYYGADDFTVEAPEGVKVSLSGRYPVNATVYTSLEYDGATAPIKFTAPGVSLEVEVPVVKSGVDTIGAATSISNDIYNTQGILVKRGATAADRSSLPAGLYIYGNKKILIK